MSSKDLAGLFESPVNETPPMLPASLMPGTGGIASQLQQPSIVAAGTPFQPLGASMVGPFQQFPSASSGPFQQQTPVSTGPSMGGPFQQFTPVSSSQSMFQPQANQAFGPAHGGQQPGGMMYTGMMNQMGVGLMTNPSNIPTSMAMDSGNLQQMMVNPYMPRRAAPAPPAGAFGVPTTQQPMQTLTVPTAVIGSNNSNQNDLSLDCLIRSPSFTEPQSAGDEDLDPFAPRSETPVKPVAKDGFYIDEADAGLTGEKKEEAKEGSEPNTEQDVAKEDDIKVTVTEADPDSETKKADDPQQSIIGGLWSRFGRSRNPEKPAEEKETKDPEDGKGGNEQRFLGDGQTFKGKLIGVLEVKEARGDKMCQDAVQELKMAIKASGEHKQRIIIQISVEGIKIRDEKTGDCLYHHPVHKISFIAQDISDARAFGYIYGSPENGHRFFGIKTEKAAGQVVVAMRDLFQVVFDMKKKEIEEAKQNLDAQGGSGINQSAASFPGDSSHAGQLGQMGQPGHQSAAGVDDLLGLANEISAIQAGIQQIDRINPPISFQTDSMMPFSIATSNTASVPSVSQAAAISAKPPQTGQPPQTGDSSIVAVHKKPVAIMSSQPRGTEDFGAAPFLPPPPSKAAVRSRPLGASVALGAPESRVMGATSAPEDRYAAFETFSHQANQMDAIFPNSADFANQGYSTAASTSATGSPAMTAMAGPSVMPKYQSAFDQSSPLKMNASSPASNNSALEGQQMTRTGAASLSIFTDLDPLAPSSSSGKFFLDKQPNKSSEATDQMASLDNNVGHILSYSSNSPWDTFQITNTQNAYRSGEQATMSKLSFSPDMFSNSSTNNVLSTFSSTNRSSGRFSSQIEQHGFTVNEEAKTDSLLSNATLFSESESKAMSCYSESNLRVALPPEMDCRSLSPAVMSSCLNSNHQSSYGSILELESSPRKFNSISDGSKENLFSGSSQDFSLMNDNSGNFTNTDNSQRFELNQDDDNTLTGRSSEDSTSSPSIIPMPSEPPPALPQRPPKPVVMSPPPLPPKKHNMTLSSSGNKYNTARVVSNIAKEPYESSDFLRLGANSDALLMRPGKSPERSFMTTDHRERSTTNKNVVDLYDFIPEFSSNSDVTSISKPQSHSASFLSNKTPLMNESVLQKTLPDSSKDTSSNKCANEGDKLSIAELASMNVLELSQKLKDGNLPNYLTGMSLVELVDYINKVNDVQHDSKESAKEKEIQINSSSSISCQSSNATSNFFSNNDMSFFANTDVKEYEYRQERRDENLHQPASLSFRQESSPSSSGQYALYDTKDCDSSVSSHIPKGFQQSDQHHNNSGNTLTKNTTFSQGGFEDDFSNYNPNDSQNHRQHENKEIGDEPKRMDGEKKEESTPFDKYAVFRELQLEEELVAAWKSPTEEVCDVVSVKSANKDEGKSEDNNIETKLKFHHSSAVLDTANSAETSNVETSGFTNTEMPHSNTRDGLSQLCSSEGSPLPRSVDSRSLRSCYSEDDDREKGAPQDFIGTGRDLYQRLSQQSEIDSSEMPNQRTSHHEAKETSLASNYGAQSHAMLQSEEDSKWASFEDAYPTPDVNNSDKNYLENKNLQGADDLEPCEESFRNLESDNTFPSAYKEESQENGSPQCNSSSSSRKTSAAAIFRPAAEFIRKDSYSILNEFGNDSKAARETECSGNESESHFQGGFSIQSPKSLRDLHPSTATSNIQAFCQNFRRLEGPASYSPQSPKGNFKSQILRQEFDNDDEEEYSDVNNESTKSKLAECELSSEWGKTDDINSDDKSNEENIQQDPFFSAWEPPNVFSQSKSPIEDIGIHKNDFAEKPAPKMGKETWDLSFQSDNEEDPNSLRSTYGYFINKKEPNEGLKDNNNRSVDEAFLPTRGQEAISKSAEDESMNLENFDSDFSQNLFSQNAFSDNFVGAAQGASTNSGNHGGGGSGGSGYCSNSATPPVYEGDRLSNISDDFSNASIGIIERDAYSSADNNVHLSERTKHIRQQIDSEFGVGFEGSLVNSDSINIFRASNDPFDDDFFK